MVLDRMLMISGVCSMFDSVCIEICLMFRFCLCDWVIFIMVILNVYSIGEWMVMMVMFLVIVLVL